MLDADRTQRSRSEVVFLMINTAAIITPPAIRVLLETRLTSIHKLLYSVD